MQSTLLVLFLSSAGLTSAYLCYHCSYDKLYNTNEPWNLKACMTNPDSIHTNGNEPCNSTSYCMYQEMYDKNLKVVTSFYRSCVAKAGTIGCIEDWTHVTCSGYCQGNFCNRNETGEHYKIHFG